MRFIFRYVSSAIDSKLPSRAVRFEKMRSATAAAVLGAVVAAETELVVAVVAQTEVAVVAVVAAALVEDAEVEVEVLVEAGAMVVAVVAALVLNRCVSFVVIFGRLR